MAITKINTPELLDINTTGAKQLPSGTTAQRPTTGVTAGDFRYNTTDDRVEYYDGTSPYDAAKWFQIDTEAIPTPVPVGSEHFNVNTYFGNGATQIIDAKFNEAANFNGSSSHISTSNPLGTGNVAYSISAWIYLNDTSHTGGIYTIWDGGTTAGTYLFFKVDAGKISIGNYGGSVTSTNTLAVNQWVHVAVTRDTSNNVELYVNGSSDTTGTLTLNLGNHSPKIGALNNSVQNFNGKIDQVRIYITDLGATQVEDLYTDETTTTASSLSFPSGETATATYQLDGNGDDISGAYSATSTTDIGYTGLKFTPDFVWIKQRSSPVRNHVLFDTVRGPATNLNILYSDLTNGQDTSVGNGFLSSISTNALNLGSSVYVNGSGEDYVAWNWKAGGAAVSNTDGTITSQVSANVDAGFSIVEWTGDGNASARVGHGISTPDMIITKSITDTNDWNVNHIGIPNQLVYLQSTGAAFSGGGTNGAFGYQSTNTSTTFGFTGGSSSVNNSNKLNSNYIAYCFHSVASYSKVGSYQGDRPNTVTVYTTDDGTSTGANGFEPSFLMIKDSSTNPGENWIIVDNKREGASAPTKVLYPNTSVIEDSYTVINFTSDGFTVGNTGLANTSGATIIYLAIA